MELEEINQTISAKKGNVKDNETESNNTNKTELIKIMKENSA